MKKTKYVIAAALISALVTLGSIPALAVGYGSITPSSGVTQAFDKAQLDPDLVYYHDSADLAPNAIIGMKKGYTLDSTLWLKCVSQAGVKNHIANMKNVASQVSVSLYGFDILDEAGKKIGVWYSPLNAPTFVRKVSEKTVDIHTPYHQSSLHGIYYAE